MELSTDLQNNMDTQSMWKTVKYQRETHHSHILWVQYLFKMNSQYNKNSWRWAENTLSLCIIVFVIIIFTCDWTWRAGHLSRKSFTNGSPWTISWRRSAKVVCMSFSIDCRFLSALSTSAFISILISSKLSSFCPLGKFGRKFTSALLAFLMFEWGCAYSGLF